MFARLQVAVLSQQAGTSVLVLVRAAGERRSPLTHRGGEEGEEGAGGVCCARRARYGGRAGAKAAAARRAGGQEARARGPRAD